MHGTLKTYPGFPHGMLTTNAEEINSDLWAFFKPAIAVAAIARESAPTNAQKCSPNPVISRHIVTNLLRSTKDSRGSAQMSGLLD